MTLVTTFSLTRNVTQTFHSSGTCPYGTRCRFVHMDNTQRYGSPSAPANYLPYQTIDGNGVPSAPATTTTTGHLTEFFGVVNPAEATAEATFHPDILALQRLRAQQPDKTMSTASTDTSLYSVTTADEYGGESDMRRFAREVQQQTQPAMAFDNRRLPIFQHISR